MSNPVQATDIEILESQVMQLSEADRSHLLGAWAAEETSAANWPQRFIFRRFLTQYLDIGMRKRQKLPSLGPIFARTSSAAQAPRAFSSQP